MIAPGNFARPTYHQSPKDPAAALAPSTVWRWLSWLGKSPPLEKICDLIRQKDPNCAVHRKIAPIRANKYRSEERRVLLQRALRLIEAEEIFDKVFGKKIFPHFATGAATR